MRERISPWGLGAIALGLLACGARTGLQELQTDAAGPSVEAGIDGGADAQEADSQEAAPPCVNWSVATQTPIELTDPIGDSMLTSAVMDGDRIYVASMNNNDPSPDPTWRVRAISTDLATVWPSQVVLQHGQSVGLSGMSLASRFGHRGGIAWDESNGCRFISIADDGSAAASPVGLVKGSCFWLWSISSGFLALDSESFVFAPLTLLTLDASGAVTKVKSDVVPEQSATTSALWRVVFDDSTMLLAWTVGQNSVMVQRFNESGDALSQPKTLFNSVVELAMGSLGSSALVAWSPNSAGGGVMVEPIDEDGNVTGAQSVIEAPSQQTIGRLRVSASDGNPLVAWTRGEAGAEHTLMVRSVKPSGEPSGSAFVVPTPLYLQSLRLIQTPGGMVIVFDGEKPQTLTQVFATRLVCGP